MKMSRMFVCTYVLYGLIALTGCGLHQKSLSDIEPFKSYIGQSVITNKDTWLCQDAVRGTLLLISKDDAEASNKAWKGFIRGEVPAWEPIVVLAAGTTLRIDKVVYEWKHEMAGPFIPNARYCDRIGTYVSITVPGSKGIIQAEFDWAGERPTTLGGVYEPIWPTVDSLRIAPWEPADTPRHRTFRSPL